MAPPRAPARRGAATAASCCTLLVALLALTACPAPAAAQGGPRAPPPDILPGPTITASVLGASSPGGASPSLADLSLSAVVGSAALTNSDAPPSGDEVPFIPRFNIHAGSLNGGAAFTQAADNAAAAASDTAGGPGGRHRRALLGAPAATKQWAVQGLNLYDQRTARNGNQYTVEPPDQALCVGSGFVVEAVNDVIRVYNATDGTALTAAVDLNTFYNYAPAIDRTDPNKLVYGPSITDPTCLYDKDNQRFIVVVLTIEVDPATGNTLGPNHLDIAVSNFADPTGTWSRYSIPVQNDGTQGTPNHGAGPCLGDFPHIGIDLYGNFYITTNEFQLTGSGSYTGTNVYGMRRADMVTGSAFNVTSWFIKNGGGPAFTLAPTAIAPTEPSPSDAATGPGYAYFLNTLAFYYRSSSASSIAVWRLSGTKTLATATLNYVQLSTGFTYYIPSSKASAITQKAGDYPYGQSTSKQLGTIDGSDSRMLSVTLAGGRLYGVFASAATPAGQSSTTKRYVTILVVVTPGTSATLSASLTKWYVVSSPNNHVIDAAVAVTSAGKGVIGFTLVGPSYYPSAGYVTFDLFAASGSTLSPLAIPLPGAGPQDGFSEYGGTGPGRWGDYAAAAVDEADAVYLANEYIAQTCTLAAYNIDPTCGNTRVPLGNWATGITKLTLA